MDWYKSKTITSWPQLSSFLIDKKRDWGSNWIYRGQQDSAWGLETSLERAAHRRFGINYRKLPSIEATLVREFKRHSVPYKENFPKDEDVLEWLALMQHHGTPTRLQDWTYSFYVALFFAVEAASPGQEAAIWCINHKWYWEQLRSSHLSSALVGRLKEDKTGGKTPETINEILKINETLAVPLTPFNMNERLSIQQGIFLAPLDLTSSFEENISAIAPVSELRKNAFKVKLRLSKRFLMESLGQLHAMNMNHRSLFPGLDGFAANLRNRVVTLSGELFAQGGKHPKLN